MLKQNNKGQSFSLSNLPQVALLFGLAVIVLSQVADVVSTIQADQTTNSAAFNVSQDGLTGLLNLSGNMDTVGTIIGVVIIISALLAAFIIRNR